MPQLPMDLQTLRGNRVVASFSPTQHLPIAAPAVPLIAADVGGTHVRVGLVRATPDQGIDVIAYRRDNPFNLTVEKPASVSALKFKF